LTTSAALSFLDAVEQADQFLTERHQNAIRALAGEAAQKTDPIAIECTGPPGSAMRFERIPIAPTTAPVEPATTAAPSSNPTVNDSASSRRAANSPTISLTIGDKTTTTTLAEMVALLKSAPKENDDH
jgi:hypothetical protein